MYDVRLQLFQIASKMPAEEGVVVFCLSYILLPPHRDAMMIEPVDVYAPVLVRIESLRISQGLLCMKAREDCNFMAPPLQLSGGVERKRFRAG